MIVDGLRLEAKGGYGPREDSYILADVVERYAYGKVLDVGTGTGIQAIVAAKKGLEVTASDVDPKALDCARENAKTNRVDIEFIQSDVFSNITAKYNTIIFNPPYLPSHWYQLKHVALDGGRQGRMFIDRFIAECRNHVMEDHIFILLESSFNHYEKDIKRLNADVAAKKHYFFEDIVVLAFK
ncbi:MAG TPA: HemK2/MTQ2 family protein methyltransferase [Candidatus Baltobacteraceae bacterium]|nr:HemK2/MTQ2 family protein methyltransferase [Candidatus Baltobacteraceae bacterium]